MGALFSPFNYLKLTQHGKWIVDWIIPFGFALCFVVMATFCLPKFDFHSENGLIAMMRSFVETLPGFYIAALTAVATFGRPKIMDTPLNPGDIYLKKKIEALPSNQWRRVTGRFVPGPCLYLHWIANGKWSKQTSQCNRLQLADH